MSVSSTSSKVFPQAPFSLMSWPLRVAISVATVLVLLIMQRVLAIYISDYVVQIVVMAGINIILAVSLNLINGITGQFSLGHAGFMVVGAYAAAAFTYYKIAPILESLGESGRVLVFLIALILSALAAALAGFFVGLPSLRLRGDYLTIVTLGFNQIILVLINNSSALQGASGFKDLPQFTNFAWVFGLVILCVLCMRNICVSSLGRSMRAVRDDEIAASAVGINTTKTKMTAFIISSLWAGVAGALQAHLLQTTDPSQGAYGFQKSVEIVVMVVLGGLGSITGAIVTAAGLTILSELLRSIEVAFAVGFGLIALAVVLSHAKHRAEIQRSWRGYFSWLMWPIISTAVLMSLYFHAPLGNFLQSLGLTTLANFLSQTRALLDANKAALRYIIYALILIVLMLLRPQGLLGRSEFSWSLFRRARDTAPDKNGDQNVRGALE